MCVRRSHPLRAGEGADQHVQRRAWQVEVGQQNIHHPETVARQNEEIGIGIESLYVAALPAALSSKRRLVVPSATTRPPLRRASLTVAATPESITPRSACIRCRPTSSVRTWKKRSHSYMERDRHALDPLSVEGGQQCGREVQPGCRGGDRAFVPREDRLIIVRIFRKRTLRADDIRRQGECAGASKCIGELCVPPIERQRHAAIRLARQHGRREILGALEGQRVARPEAARVAGQSLPRAVRPRTIERDADARRAPSRGKLGRNDLAIVGD